ncbi:MAG: hypothetical protein KBT22_05800 [Bacteroidales bacterium]|nr:hypothetical protein [Candidatus Scybalocola fimicaballi]
MLNRIFCLVACSGLVLFSGCKPVNSSTKIMKTPDAYTRNYCCGEVSVPKSAEKGTPWIVYSDRNNNSTYHIPGGKVKLKEVSYFEPLAVIDEEGDYVEVVKYEKGVFDGRRVKDPNKAEYLGWMPKSNLVLSSNAMTDVATGFVMKMITMVNDTAPLIHTENFFTDGEVVIYSEPELLNPIGTIPFQKPIFLSKRSVDKDKCLVIGEERITPLNATQVKSGWISSSMIRPLGEMLYGDFSKIPIKDFKFTGSYSKNLKSISKNAEQRYLAANKIPNFVGVDPIYKIEENGDNTSTIKTTTPVSIINDDLNLVYSLAGSTITKRFYEDLSDNLRHINIMVAFSGQKEVADKFNQYVNFLQQLNGIIKKHSSDIHFSLGYFVGFDATKNENSKCEPIENIELALSNMEKYATDYNRRVMFTDDAWSALRQSVDMLGDHIEEQNIVIVIGENGNQKERVDDALIDKLVNYNCRIIGCQLFSNNGNTFNNFVLQVEDMISRSAEQLSKEKKNHLVHSEQLRSNNKYKEFSDNVYGLDYPKNSMHQGWVIFPKKKESLSPDLLLSVTDSTIGMIEHETKDIFDHISESFKHSSVWRTSINPEWLKLCGYSPSVQGLSALFQPLFPKKPVNNYPTELTIDSKKLKKGKYTLFVTDLELDRIRQYLNDLLEVRVDSKSLLSSDKKEKARSCPDMITRKVNETPVDQREYLSTSKARKSMFKAYIRWAQDEKVYPTKKSLLKKKTLSENQREAFSMFSFDPFMSTIMLSDIKNKSKVSDQQLDLFQEYLLSKQKELEKAVNNGNKFEFNGQTFYSIDSSLMP